MTFLFLLVRRLSRSYGHLFGSQPTASKHSSSTLDHFENMSMEVYELAILFLIQPTLIKEEERSVRRVHIGLALSFSNPSKDETEERRRRIQNEREINSSIESRDTSITLVKPQKQERRRGKIRWAKGTPTSFSFFFLFLSCRLSGINIQCPREPKVV